MSLLKLYPIKAIQNCAFASSLKQKMQTRRHAKLYVLPKRQLVKSANSNPMRVRSQLAHAVTCFQICFGPGLKLLTSGAQLAYHLFAVALILSACMRSQV